MCRCQLNVTLNCKLKHRALGSTLFKLKGAQQTVISSHEDLAEDTIYHLLKGVCVCMFAPVFEKKQGSQCFWVFPFLFQLKYTGKECWLWLVLRAGNKSAKTHKAWQKPKFPPSKKRHTPLCYFVQLFTWLFSPAFVLPFSSFYHGL